MANTQYSSAVSRARDYYNSDDADRFYFRIWGGEDIHIGLYESDDDSISEASRRTVARMADLVGDLGPGMRVLDLGSGYGGVARYLAERFGCSVVGLNLSEVENERSRTMNRERRLDPLIEIVDGSYEEIPFEDGAFDVVWSQDAFLHSGDRGRVIAEAARVLKPGGTLIFTDPMQADDCPQGVLQPILDRLLLDTLGSPGFYRQQAQACGLREVGFEDHTPQLVQHYARVLGDTEAREQELAEDISPDYITRMKQGLRHWVAGGRQGYLCWGIFRFRRP